MYASNIISGCICWQMWNPEAFIVLAEIFLERVEELRQFIRSRPERSIALVSHSGVLEVLSGGYLFKNGEIKTLTEVEVPGL